MAKICRLTVTTNNDCFMHSPYYMKDTLLAFISTSGFLIKSHQLVPPGLGKLCNNVTLFFHLIYFLLVLHKLKKMFWLPGPSLAHLGTGLNQFHTEIFIYIKVTKYRPCFSACRQIFTKEYSVL